MPKAKSQVALQSVRLTLALMLFSLYPTVLNAQNPRPNGFPSNNAMGAPQNVARQPIQQQSFSGVGTSNPSQTNYPSNYSPTYVASNTNPSPAASNITSGKPEATAEAADPGKIPVRNLLQIFYDGGFMMYPIALCSFALMVFSFERFVSLRRGRVIPRPFVQRIIEQIQQQQLDRDEALELCDRNPSAIARIFAAAIKRYGKPAVEIEQAVLDAGERECNQLRRYMRLLSAISNVSPLLGLLGTVLGMIQSFNDIAGAQAMGRPDLLAGGIGQALLTTAAGLLVAIPAYIMYIYFIGHIDRLIMEMDLHAQKLVDVVSAEGLQENDTSRTRTRSRKAA